MICSKCGIEKIETEFSLSGNKQQRRTCCKACQKIYRAQYYSENSEEQRAYTKTFYSEHGEEIKKNRRNKYAQNPQTERDLSAKWRKENPIKAKQVNAKYYANHREKMCARSKKWRQENPEKKNDIDRVRRARVRSSGCKLSVREWIDIKTQYGNRCVYCNKSKPLTLDHVIPIKLGGTNNINNIVPACHSCNSSKKATPLLVWLYNKVSL